MPRVGADEYPRHDDGKDRVDNDDLEIEDDDDLRDDAADLFGVDLGDINVSIDVKEWVQLQELLSHISLEEGRDVVYWGLEQSKKYYQVFVQIDNFRRC
jgi:hypothetical protein